MNSYAFGLNSSWSLFILFLFISVAFTVWAYRFTIPPVSRNKKVLLIFLRSFGIALLIFTLFEPVISLVTGKEVKPKLAVLLDNSLSSAMDDASGNRKKLFLSAIENSDFESLNNDELEIALFDSKVRFTKDFSKTNLDFQGQITDISKAIKEVMKKSETENISAVLLITDGAFNNGTNPIYDADIFGKPIFTIGIGDSSEPRDISIQSMLTNDIVYVDNPVPVNVNVKVSGYNEGNLTLTLYDNAQKIGEQQFIINDELQDFTAVFEFLPKTEGVHKLTAKLNNLPNEITIKNNSKSDYIEVLKNKRKISIFAGSPSADVSFIRNTLLEEKGIEVKNFVQKNSSEYYELVPQDIDFRETDLFILIGYPIATTNPQIISKIKNELEKGKPILFIASKFINYSLLRPLEDYLPFKTTSSKQNEFLALPDFNPLALSNPLLRITGTNDDLALWNQLPPVFRTETFVNVKPESEIVATMKINNVPLKEPLILTRSIRKNKSAAVLGYDLYRWKLLGYAADAAKGKTNEPDLFSIFFKNSAKWLSTDIDNKLVDIKTTKKFYTRNEKVEFIAQIYDQSYTPIDNAVVNLNVKGGNNDNKEIILTSLGNGRYYGSLEGLSEGGYYFSGKVNVNGRNAGEDNGRFSVGETEIEYNDLSMNSVLLRTLANRTGGKFYLPDDSKEFLNDLKKSKYFKTKSITLKSELALWNLPWLFACAILCFSLEWFLRKRAGMI